MVSKTKIKQRTKKKTDKTLVETIISAKKQNPELASLLSSPTRKRVKKNLHEINEQAEEGETLIVPGKVLGIGELKKKVDIIALSFSESAIKKLDRQKIKTSTIKEEIGKGKKLEGRVLK
jgi:large subunit ribosomal protein L18e